LRIHGHAPWPYDNERTCFSDTPQTFICSCVIWEIGECWLAGFRLELAPYRIMSDLPNPRPLSSFGCSTNHRSHMLFASLRLCRPVAAPLAVLIAHIALTSSIGVLPSSAVAQAVTITDKAVIVFRDACLATAPSFEKAMTAAKKLGITPQMDLGASVVGMSSDGSISLQVRGRKECAVTGESSPGNKVADQFAFVLAQSSSGAAGSALASSLKSGEPVRILLKGQTFVARHDRKGGEAYVIINMSGL
jgi:hypothetical protein